jgi:hypothetical protein
MKYSYKFTIYSLFILFFLFLFNSSLLAQKGIINKGARIVVSTDARIVVSGEDYYFLNESESGEDGIVDLDGLLFLEGPFYNNALAGECFVNFNGNGKVILNGNNQQVIGGSRGIRFENIEIVNTEDVLLNRNLRVENELFLNEGNLLLNGNSLYLEENSYVSGSLGSSMIIANSGGFLYKKFNNIGSFTFPIGDNTGTTEYTPIDFSLNGYSSLTNAYFGFNVSDEKYSENTSPSEYLTRYWNLQYSGVSSPDFSLDFHYLTNDVVGIEADIFAARYFSSERDVYNKVDDYNHVLYVNNIENEGNFTGVDGTIPSVIISSPESDPTNSNPFSVNIDFSEQITSFDTADIESTNCSLSNLQTSDSISFTADVSPLTDDTVSIYITGGVVEDIAGNNNSASNVYNIEYDGKNPEVLITSAENSPTNSDFLITVSFNEEVVSFSLSDIIINNGVAGNLTEMTNNIEWTAEISPISDGEVSVSIPASAATDIAGNPSNASNTFSINYDATSPDVSISSAEPDPTNSGLFQTEIQFTEIVSGFSATDINVTNGTISGLSTTDSINFMADIQPVSDGIVNIQVPPSVSKDSAGNWNIQSNEFDIYYDATQPTINSLNPSDNATDVAVNSNLEIVFNETVNIGSGNIIIKRMSDQTVFETLDVSGSQLSGGGTSNITIDPVNDFESSTGYYVLIENTCFTDMAGNNFAGISSSDTWNFSSADVNDPVIVSLSPPDNETCVSVSSNLGIKFSEAVYAQSGNITIKESVGGTTFETIDVTSTQVTGIATDSVVINLSDSFNGETDYYVLIESTAFEDSEGNYFAGISSSTQWNFTSEDIISPVAESFTPMDEATSIPVDALLSITFNENVFKGTGYITIKRSTDNNIFETIDVGSGQVSGAGTQTISIDPSNEFSSNTEYYVIIDAGAFKDDNNNLYSGISNITEWNFTSADVISPTVSVASNESNPTNQSTFDVFLEFSEEVKNLTPGDISVTNGNCTNISTTDSITYTATISVTSEGNIEVQVPAGVASDLAGNGNEASPVFSITFDGTKPESIITSSHSDPTNISQINLTIEFTEWVGGFESSDLSTGNCTITNLTTTDSISFIAEIEPLTDGLVTVNVPADIAADSAGNYNLAADQFSINYDGTSPTVEITSSEPDPTNQSPFEVVIEFSEMVSGFELSDVQVTNGSAADLSTSDDVMYTLSIVPAADGLVKIDIPEGIAQDNAGNSNLSAPQFTIEFLETAPEVSITTTEPDPTNNQHITLNVVFTSEISGFEKTDLQLTNAQITDLTTSDSINFVAQISFSEEGTCSVQVPEAVAEDEAGNENIASELFTILYDPSQPSVILSSSEPDPTSNNSFDVLADFSEEVNGFSLSDCSVSNADLSNLQQIDDSTYEFTVAPISEGEVTILLPQNSLEDLAGNTNTESNTFSIYFDGNHPTVSISSSVNVPTNISPIDVSVEFSEEVYGFEVTDIQTTNALLTDINSSDNIVYTLSVEPQNEGDFSINIPENVVTDLSGNGNIASSEYVNRYDITAPELSLFTNQGDTISQPVIDIQAEASETIEDFEMTDIQTTNCYVLQINSSDNINYTIQIEPLNKGEINLTVPSGAYNDLAGNLNENESNLNLYFNGTVSINDNAETSLCEIFSSHNKIIVKIKEESIKGQSGSIKIFNSYGEMLIAKKINKKDRYEFNIYASTNVYYVKVQLNGNIYTGKVILFKE